MFIAFVATRILALYLLVDAVIMVSPVVLLLVGSWDNNVALYTIVPSTVRLIMATLLWFLAATISTKMVDSSPNSEPGETKMTSFDWWGLGFALFGLFAIFSSIHELVSAAIINSGMADLISGLLKMSLGAYLVLGWKGLVGLLIRAREFGRKPEYT
jgi:hypothetical protein